MWGLPFLLLLVGYFDVVGCSFSIFYERLRARHPGVGGRGREEALLDESWRNDHQWTFELGRRLGSVGRDEGRREGVSLI